MDRLYFGKRIIGKIDIGNFDNRYLHLIKDYYNDPTYGIKREIQEQLSKMKFYLPRIYPEKGKDNQFWCQGYEYILNELFLHGQNIVKNDGISMQKPCFLMDFLSKYVVHIVQ